MNLALFDFDGTITTGDGFLPFIRAVTPRWRVMAGTLVLAPLALGYRRGWIRPTSVRQSVVWFALRGRSQRELAELGERYAAGELARQVRPEALERIRWHRAQGDLVVVVSASLDVYLAPWCRTHGVELICTELETRGGTCTGRYLGRDCSGEEKARRVCERHDLARHPLVYAYGDTAEDGALLSLAQRRYFRWRELDGSEPGSPVPLHPG